MMSIDARAVSVIVGDPMQHGLVNARAALVLTDELRMWRLPRTCAI